jgi:hypothetical protein
MIFGMAYLLLPPYVGRTLADHRLPGLHFVLAYLGVALLAVGWLRDGLEVVFALGAVAWSLGVTVFLGALGATIGPALLEEPLAVLRQGDRPQRSTQLATAMLPVAIGYLTIGTGVFLWIAFVGPGRWTLSQVLHLYGAGFGAVLIFALGARLLIGFYHVSPPRYVLWVVLITGSIAPGFLAVTMWVRPWFFLGALMEVVAMIGYGIVVIGVAYRTDRRRFGLFGIVLGAAAGVSAVIVAAPLAFGSAAVIGAVEIHRTRVIRGFFPLPIMGHPTICFPVTERQFFGATHRGVTTTIALLAGGVGLRSIGFGTGNAWLELGGVIVSVLGASAYLYLMARRFSG